MSLADLIPVTSQPQVLLNMHSMDKARVDSLTSKIAMTATLLIKLGIVGRRYTLTASEQAGW